MVEHNEAATILYCYMHEDAELSHELVLHMSGLKRAGFVQNLYTCEMSADDAWKDTIEQHIHEAHIILLSISPAFLASQDRYEKEMHIILERHQQGKIHVIPVLLYPVDWKRSPVGTLEALPTQERAVSSWRVIDEGFVEVVKGVYEAIKLYWTRQKISQLTLEVQQLSSELNKVAYETQQISREIEQAKPDLTDAQHLSSGSETANLPASRPAIRYNFTKDDWFREYQEALSVLQDAVTTSVYQCKQIEEFHAS